jgi:hypothetical protein
MVNSTQQDAKGTGILAVLMWFLILRCLCHLNGHLEVIWNGETQSKHRSKGGNGEEEMPIKVRPCEVSLTREVAEGAQIGQEGTENGTVRVRLWVANRFLFLEEEEKQVFSCRFTLEWTGAIVVGRSMKVCQTNLRAWLRDK